MCVDRAAAYKLCLDYAGRDVDALAGTLNGIVWCPGCASAAILELTDLVVAHADEHEPNWVERMADALEVVEIQEAS